MVSPDKAPKTGNRVNKKLVTAGVVLALLTGAAGYKKGESDKSLSNSQDSTAALISKLMSHPQPLERLKFVKGQSPEQIEKLKGNALLDNATRVQGSILAISKGLGISGQEVFERLVSPEAQKAYKNRHVAFLFVRDDPNNPECLNPSRIEVRGIDDEFEQIFIPLDASPNNPHPDHNAPDQTWIPIAGIQGYTR